MRPLPSPNIEHQSEWRTNEVRALVLHLADNTGGELNLRLVEPEDRSAVGRLLADNIKDDLLHDKTAHIVIQRLLDELVEQICGWLSALTMYCCVGKRCAEL
jgi:hypothetical protein